MILALGASAANANEADIEIAHAHQVNSYNDTFLPNHEAPAARAFHAPASDSQGAFQLQQNLDNQGGADH